MAAMVQEGICSACGKKAAMKCPTCVKFNFPLATALFCSQSCFKENWPKHKALHKLLKKMAKENKAAEAQAEAMEQDDLAMPREFKGYKFTGELRPARVTARRTVPRSIARPDYADDMGGVPHSEMRARYDPPPQRSAEAIERLTRACRVGREVLDIAGKAVAVGVTGDELDR